MLRRVIACLYLNDMGMIHRGCVQSIISLALCWVEVTATILKISIHDKHSLPFGYK